MIQVPLYRLKGVEKGYSHSFQLQIPSLEIPGRGIFALLGPNGAGKSTLLRLLHFLDPCDDGEIFFNGQSISYPAPLTLRRCIAMVFQKPVMLSGSVRQNIAYGMRLRGELNPGRLQMLLESLDLTHLAEAPAKTLSGGEAQRVALARALATEPEVLLLDEPTANLDPYNIRLIEHIIRETSARGSMSTILVTHDVFQVRRIADTAAFIVAGNLVEVGKIDALFDHPSDNRTRAYLQGELIG